MHISLLLVLGESRIVYHCRARLDESNGSAQTIEVCAYFRNSDAALLMLAHQLIITNGITNSSSAGLSVRT